MFYDNVRELCIKHNINITQLAKELGISTALPTAWKKGAVPRMSTVKKIADYFAVSSEYLLREETSTNIHAENSTVVDGNLGNVAVGATQLTEMEVEIIRIFRLLDMRSKNNVMAYLYNIEDNLAE